MPQLAELLCRFDIMCVKHLGLCLHNIQKIVNKCLFFFTCICNNQVIFCGNAFQLIDSVFHFGCRASFCYKVMQYVLGVQAFCSAQLSSTARSLECTSDASEAQITSLCDKSHAVDSVRQSKSHRVCKISQQFRIRRSLVATTD